MDWNPIRSERKSTTWFHEFFWVVLQIWSEKPALCFGLQTIYLSVGQYSYDSSLASLFCVPPLCGQGAGRPARSRWSGCPGCSAVGPPRTTGCWSRTWPPPWSLRAGMELHAPEGEPVRTMLEHPSPWGWMHQRENQWENHRKPGKPVRRSMVLTAYMLRKGSVLRSLNKKYILNPFLSN